MKKTLLVVDSSESNKEILSQNFAGSYDIIEAKNQDEAFEILKSDKNVSAVFLSLDHSEKEESVSVIGEMSRVKISKMNRLMLEEMADMVESRSEESGRHIKRVCGFSEIILKCLRSTFPEYKKAIPDDEIDKIIFSAILHDVGKIFISDSILNKPGKLTPEEFDIMKEHTTLGAKHIQQWYDHGILDDDIFRYVYDICRFHHERFDGNGYPDHLHGNEIPIWAQVVSVADVYDALTSPRVYKKAFEHEVAVDMIRNNKCGVFNPKILQVFEDCQDKLLEFNSQTLVPDFNQDMEF